MSKKTIHSCEREECFRNRNGTCLALKTTEPENSRCKFFKTPAEFASGQRKYGGEIGPGGFEKREKPEEE